MYRFIAIYTYSCIYVCKDIQNISYNKRIRIYFTLKNNATFLRKPHLDYSLSTSPL